QIVTPPRMRTAICPSCSSVLKFHSNFPLLGNRIAPSLTVAPLPSRHKIPRIDPFAHSVCRAPLAPFSRWSEPPLPRSMAHVALSCDSHRDIQPEQYAPALCLAVQQHLAAVDHWRRNCKS